MDHYREKTSAFFTRLGHGLGRRRPPTIVPLSRSLGSPALQTSLIFELPDELILSILSHIPPDPRLTGPYAWFRTPYRKKIGDYYNQWAKFLRPLSMTCRAMRLRFLPWVWERLVFPAYSSEAAFVRRLNNTVNVLQGDEFLATSVKFMKIHYVWTVPSVPPLAKCLESFPNLHTLSIDYVDESTTTTLKKALKGVKLPQIKTLIIPLNAYPLLQHCPNVEEVVCVFYNHDTVPSNGFLRSLASNRKSNIKRLAIPLVLWPNPSRFVVACPRLTELTVAFPYLPGTQRGETKILVDPSGRARSAVSELAVACKALPDFDTFQIVYPPLVPISLECQCGWGGCGSRMDYSEQQEQTLRMQTKDLDDWAIDCLKKPETGCREGEERKGITLRVFRFSPGHPCHSSAMIEEREV